jgi:hypothetical protein
MNKSITTTIILSLLCFPDWNAAHAAVGPLDSIDSQLISENFPLKIDIGIDSESAELEKIPGCAHVKSFPVFEADVPGKIILAICKEGEFGPSNIEATVAKLVADAKETLKNMPFAQSILAGAEPITVSLEDGKQGKALTLPYVGHGLVMVPLAYAVTARKGASIVVQAYLNPNEPRNLNKPIAVLLQAIYKRLQENRN